MSDIKFSRNQENVLSTIDFTRNIQIGVVCSIDDPKGLSTNEMQVIEERSMVPAQDFFLENNENIANVLKLMYEIRSRV
jgi:hypothetical protein